MSCPSARQATASGPHCFAVQLLGTTGGLANCTSGSASSGRSFTGSTGVRSNNLQQSLAMGEGGGTIGYKGTHICSEPKETPQNLTSFQGNCYKQENLKPLLGLHSEGLRPIALAGQFTEDAVWIRICLMDDAELQDEPLQIRLMDHDTYSANDAIGKVYLDLNPLLLPPQGTTVKTAFSDSVTSTNSLSGGNTMSGWFPVYDTMHGIRGEVNVIVKVELFSDFNKFRQSSCGVQFFNSSTIPHGYHANIVHGMVEELVVSDDPEYQWIDKIRTPRASNEARQTQFFKLSGEVQRKIGLKVLDFGGNAV
ncbi:C2 domain-containing protein 5, partial [Homalodisca vitripennis]